MDITGKTLKHGNIDLQAVCIDFCTEEQRYLDPDSHFIHIPRDLYVNFLKKKADAGLDNIPLYVGVRNSKDPKGKKFYFGRVEPSTTTANSHHTMVLLPAWVFEKLKMDMMDATVDIVYVSIPQSVALMKLKGSNSLYAKRDIKSELEVKLSGYNCLNVDEEFKVGETSFRVVELRNKDNKIIEFGSIYNIDECNLDFEMCDEEIEKEKQRVEALRKADEEKLKNRELQKATSSNINQVPHNNSISNKFGTLNKKYGVFGAKVHSLKEGDNEDDNKQEEKKEETIIPFQGVGYKMAETKKPLTKQQLYEARMKAIESQKVKNENI